MTELSKKIGDMEFDGLVTDLTPHIQVSGGVIAKGAALTTYKRGTVLGMSEGGTLSIYYGTGTPNCILCDDTDVGTEEDANVTVYISGCCNPNKVTLADSYELTADDIDQLRMRGIIFKAATPAG